VVFIVTAMSSEDEALSSSMTLSRSGGSTASTTITSSSSSRAKRSSGGNTNTTTTGTLSLTQSLPSSGHRADNEEDDDDDDDELDDDELDDGELDESYNTTESSLVRVRPARSRSSRKQAKTANRRSPVDSHAIHQVTSSEVQDRPVRKLSLPGLYAVCGAPASSSSSSSSSGSSNASAYNIINTSNSTETHLATPSSSSTTTSIISPRARVRTLTNTELTKSPELPANSRAYSTSPPDANKSPGSPQRTYKTASMSPTLYDSPKRTADKEKFRRSKGSMSGATLSHIDTKTLARGLRNSQRLKKLLVRESDLIISQPSGGYSVADKTWREVPLSRARSRSRVREADHGRHAVCRPTSNRR